MELRVRRRLIQPFPFILIRDSAVKDWISEKEYHFSDRMKSILKYSIQEGVK